MNLPAAELRPLLAIYQQRQLTQRNE